MREAPADRVITTPIWATKSASSTQRWAPRKPIQLLLATQNATTAVSARPTAIHPYTPRRNVPTRVSTAVEPTPTWESESSRATEPSLGTGAAIVHPRVGDRNRGVRRPRGPDRRHGHIRTVHVARELEATDSGVLWKSAS